MLYVDAFAYFDYVLINVICNSIMTSKSTDVFFLVFRKKNPPASRITTGKINGRKKTLREKKNHFHEIIKIKKIIYWTELKKVKIVIKNTFLVSNHSSCFPNVGILKNKSGSERPRGVVVKIIQDEIGVWVIFKCLLIKLAYLFIYLFLYPGRFLYSFTFFSSFFL